MKRMMMILAIVMAASCCMAQVKERHEGYAVGNGKETEAVGRYIRTMQAEGRFQDTMCIDSYTPIFPAVFGRTDYNAVKYHRKFIDTIVLDRHTSDVMYDFFYLIDQNECCNIPDYFGKMNSEYTKKYRE